MTLIFRYIYIYIYIVGGRETKDKSMQTKDKNKREEIMTKRAHLGRFCQGILEANMIIQSQNLRRSTCLRNPRILIHSWKGRGLAMKTTRHMTDGRKEGVSLSG